MQAETGEESISAHPATVGMIPVVVYWIFGVPGCKILLCPEYDRVDTINLSGDNEHCHGDFRYTFASFRRAG